MGPYCLLCSGSLCGDPMWPLSMLPLYSSTVRYPIPFSWWVPYFPWVMHSSMSNHRAPQPLHSRLDQQYHGDRCVSFSVDPKLLQRANMQQCILESESYSAAQETLESQSSCLSLPSFGTQKCNPQWRSGSTWWHRMAINSSISLILDTRSWWSKFSIYWLLQKR